MGKTVRICVPATVANLGSGFDCLGMAVTLYNKLEVERTAEGITVRVAGEGEQELPEDETNLVARAFLAACKRLGVRAPAARIACRNEIPLARGLGSSAAAIVGGIAAAEALYAKSLSPEERLELAAELEGHADNVAAAFYGGLVIVPSGLPRARCLRFDSPHLQRLSVVLAIPEFSVPTAEARAVLPQAVPLADAVFAASRVATLLAALHSGDLRWLREGTDDRLHQPYREQLIPGGAQVRQAALDAGALASFVSGAGPTIAALCAGDAQAVGEAMVGAFSRAGQHARYEVVSVDSRGARIVEQEA